MWVALFVMWPPLQRIFSCRRLPAASLPPRGGLKRVIGVPVLDARLLTVGKLRLPVVRQEEAMRPDRSRDAGPILAELPGSSTCRTLPTATCSTRRSVASYGVSLGRPLISLLDTWWPWASR